MGGKTMKVRAILTIVAVLFPVCGNSAFGYVVTVEVEGVVTDVNTFDGLEFDGSVIVGSTVMTGSCTYDTVAPDQAGADNYGLYSLISISMNVGSYTFIGISTADEEPYFHITAEPSWFVYYVSSPRSFYSGPCYLNGEPANLEDVVPEVGFRIMYLQGDNDGTITDALPDENTFPDLSVCTVWKEFRAESWLTPAFHIVGEITSITVIPEPGTILLLGLGGLVLLRKRGK
jgi:hypothetical protein